MNPEEFALEAARKAVRNGHTGSTPACKRAAIRPARTEDGGLQETRDQAGADSTSSWSLSREVLMASRSRSGLSGEADSFGITVS